MKSKIIIIILIIISLLLGTLLVLEKIENKRLTEKMEGYADAIGELESIQ
jgi:uncharacterized protein YpmB